MNIILKIGVLAGAIGLASCFKEPEIYGLWDMALTIQGQSVPFQLDIVEKNNLTLINGAEHIELSYNRPDPNKIIVPILGYSAQLELEKKDDAWRGFWVRKDKIPAYKEPITGKRASHKMQLNKIELPSKWKMTLGPDKEKKDAILLFTETKKGSYASVLTTTGDYRYLTAIEKDNELTLSGFDGIFAFVFKGKIDQGVYSGKMYAGKSWNQDFRAAPTSSFELPSPLEATKYNGDLSKLVLTDLHDDNKKNVYSVLGPKVRVIQIFGSWCPNCIDETKFIKSWRDQNKNKAQDVAFAMIAFERSPNKAHALKMLNKAKDLYRIDYPIFVGGHTSKDKVERVLPGMENFISFPTTLFVDKKGKVRKIHAGFSGPATGKYFEKFAMDFDKTIEKLLKEN